MRTAADALQTAPLPGRPGRALRAALRSHWRHYVAEAAGLAFFIACASVFTVLLEHPASPVHQALAGHEVGRRAVLGVGMGFVIVAIVYSPWGKQSGAHINPAVTLAFWYLGKLRGADALWYGVAQVLGGLAGAGWCEQVLGRYYAHTSVHHITTRPGPDGAGVAFGAELLISFVSMAVLLGALHHARLEKVAGWLIGGLIALYILVETPYSGMSLNPARSLASAVAAQDFRALWVYLVAPPLGMGLAAVLCRGWRRGRAGGAEPPHYPAPG